jgi:hypothetical protein
MLLMRGSMEAWEGLTETAQQQTIAAHIAFARRLEASGHLKDGNGFAAGTRKLRRLEGHLEVTDRPYAGSEEALSGYYLIEAPDLATAVSLAGDCPALQSNETVEVVPIGH